MALLDLPNDCLSTIIRYTDKPAIVLTCKQLWGVVLADTEGLSIVNKEADVMHAVTLTQHLQHIQELRILPIDTSGTPCTELNIRKTSPVVPQLQDLILPGLQKLTVRCNKIDTGLHIFLSNHPELQALDLSNTLLRADMLVLLAHTPMPSLQELDLSGSRLYEGRKPRCMNAEEALTLCTAAWFQRLTKLKLSCEDKEAGEVMMSRLPSGLLQLSALVRISRLTGLAGPKKLQELVLTGDDVHVLASHLLKCSPPLRVLRVQSSWATPGSAPLCGLHSLTGLHTLHMGPLCITEDQACHLNGLVHLTELALAAGCCQLRILASMPWWHNLQSLRIAFVPNGVLCKGWRLPLSLASLSLANTPMDIVCSMVGGLIHLKELSLAGFSEATAVRSLHLPALQSLRVPWHVGIEPFESLLPQIKVFEGRCTSQQQLQGLHNVTHLHLCAPRAMSEDCKQAMLMALPHHLLSLRLSGFQLGGSFIEHLAASVPALEELDVADCDLVGLSRVCLPAVDRLVVDRDEDIKGWDHKRCVDDVCILVHEPRAVEKTPAFRENHQ